MNNFEELETLSGDRLATLAAQVENHISPQFRGQLLQADLALANALRELVDVERAKFNASHLAKMEIGERAARMRTTLYPERGQRPNAAPAFSGAFALAGRNISVRAWIGEDQKFINIEVAIL
jgi:hypothetical protein